MNSMKKSASVIEGDFGKIFLLTALILETSSWNKTDVMMQSLRSLRLGKNAIVIVRYINVLGTVSCQEESVFAQSIESRNDEVRSIEVIYPEKDMPYMAAVMTLSDKGSRGERVDTSGPRAAEILKEHGFKIVEEILLPDEEAQIKKHLIRLSDSRQVDLIITTGGTGLSPEIVHQKQLWLLPDPQCAGNLRSDQSRFYDDHKTSHVIKRCQCNKKENIDH